MFVVNVQNGPKLRRSGMFVLYHFSVEFQFEIIIKHMPLLRSFDFTALIEL